MTSQRGVVYVWVCVDVECIVSLFVCMGVCVCCVWCVYVDVVVLCVCVVHV